MRLEVRTDRIVRVTSVNDENLDLPKSLMVVDSNAPPPSFKVEKRDGDVVLETAQLVARVSLANGAVRFTDPAANRCSPKNRSRARPRTAFRSASIRERTKPSTARANTRTRR